MNWWVGQKVIAKLPGLPKQEYRGIVVVVDGERVGVHFDSEEVSKRFNLNLRALRGYLIFRDQWSSEWHLCNLRPASLKLNLMEA